jgi:hypothetical protein
MHLRKQLREFIGKNEMTWLQYPDGGFTGPIAKLFNVTAIPHTVTIESDGVLQEEHIGDASIEASSNRHFPSSESRLTLKITRTAWVMLSPIVISDSDFS